MNNDLLGLVASLLPTPSGEEYYPNVTTSSQTVSEGRLTDPAAD